MTDIATVESAHWDLSAMGDSERARLIDVIEDGGVLLVRGPQLPIEPGTYGALLDPALADERSKNISYDPANGTLSGALGTAEQRDVMKQLLASFQQCALALVHALAPGYRDALRLAPASLRLFQVEGRAASWRKDDSRLHVDAFPSRPNRGERILRVFHNLNPRGEPRVWRVGEPFADAARRFAAQAPRYGALGAKALDALGVTKSLRSEYDHRMLHLHDAMKADAAYQQSCPQRSVQFPAGSTWVCFSDQTSHAVMSGQFMLEQTLHLPVAAMRHPEKSPLRVLEAMAGRSLA